MAMKKSRLGLDYTSHLNALNYKGEVHFRAGFPYRCSAIARIIKGSLLIRIKHDIVITSNHDPEALKYTMMLSCPHTKSLRREQLPSEVPCNKTHNHEKRRGKSCQSESPLWECNKCGMVYKITMRECESIGTVVTVLKWLDLGEGRDPGDPTWWRHLDSGYLSSDVAVRDSWAKRLVEVKSGPSTFSKFERKGTVYDSMLTPEDMREFNSLSIRT